MYKLTDISYSKDGRKLFSILDTSDNVKENLTISQVQKARILGIKIENLPKYELYPFKTEKELYSYWSGLSQSYIDSIIDLIKQSCSAISFPKTVRIYVYDWTKASWYDCRIPQYLEVKCDSFIELVSYWFFFCDRVGIGFDLVDRIEAV